MLQLEEELRSLNIALEIFTVSIISSNSHGMNRQHAVIYTGFSKPFVFHIENICSYNHSSCYWKQI
jgi:hypothetical protein